MKVRVSDDYSHSWFKAGSIIHIKGHTVDEKRTYRASGVGGKWAISGEWLTKVEEANMVKKINIADFLKTGECAKPTAKVGQIWEYRGIKLLLISDRLYDASRAVDLIRFETKYSNKDFSELCCVKDGKLIAELTND